MTNLNDRISEAFSSEPRSDEVAALIAEAKTAAAEADKIATAARERALDPALTSKVVADARKLMEDHEFASARLTAALPKLDKLLKERKAAEEDARRWAAYKKLETERDEIVEELAEYSNLAERLAKIVDRLAENEKAIERLNEHALPSGAPLLRSAELIARGLSDFKEHLGAFRKPIPRISRQTKLPRFEDDERDPFLFPHADFYKPYMIMKPLPQEPARIDGAAEKAREAQVR